MLDPTPDDEEIPLDKFDLPVVEANRHRAFQDEERLVGLVVPMPDEVAPKPHDLELKIVELRDDARRPKILKLGDLRTEVDGIVRSCHGSTLPFASLPPPVERTPAPSDFPHTEIWESTMGMQALDAWPPAEARWTVRVLGRVDVSNQAGERPKFRSKSAQSLLAYLVLHPGKDVSRFLLEELLWPGSDSSKQAQNLRAAVAHLRKVLEEDSAHGSVIETRRDIVSANPRAIVSDASRFQELTEAGLRNAEEDSLYEAVSLYGGPLLEPLQDEWIYSYRL